jgi:hypothetical protein
MLDQLTAVGAGIQGKKKGFLGNSWTILITGYMTRGQALF